MFEGFELKKVKTEEAEIRLRVGGNGPPLLLLHGHPQTHLMWHQVAPRLAKSFTVVASDLRGYGESSKPPTTRDHGRFIHLQTKRPARRETHRGSFPEAPLAAVVAAAPAVVFATLAFAALALYATVRSEPRGHDRDRRNDDDDPDE